MKPPSKLAGIAVLACAALQVGGCAVAIDGEATGVTSGAPSLPASLPFTPTIAERFNPRNNGSSFEPCIAYTASELAALGLSPLTQRDAAVSNAPNYRGCQWDLTTAADEASNRGLNWVSQFVGNQPSLSAYKSAHDNVRWQADLVVGGVAIAVGSSRPGECGAVFRSGQSIVVTLVEFDSSTRSLSGECDRAVRLAALATTKAPR